MHPVQIKDHMVRFPYVSSPDQTITEAMDYMKELGVRHLPVISEQELSGIVSERDLKAALNLENASSLTIGDIMQKEVYVVDQKTPLSEVVEEMADGKMGSAVVANQDGQVAGIFTTTDALRLLASRLEDELSSDLFISDEEEAKEFELINGRNY